MGRKLFISFLGNTRYQDTIYVRPDGVCAPKTPFVQEVLFDCECKDWAKNNNNKIYIVCTEGSKGSYDTNWMGENGHASLKNILKQKPYYHITETVKIEEGKEKDLWLLFNKVYDLIDNEDDGDELYLDVTNAFRSFPTLATTLLAYAKLMKGAKVKKIYYGLFDRDAEKNPIVDLSPVIQLQECVDIANGFVKFGRLNGLVDGMKRAFANKEVVDSLEGLDHALSSNIGHIIREGKFVNILKQHKKDIRSLDLPQPARDILDQTINKLSEFKVQGKEENLLHAARWTFKYNMLPQAFAMGKEYINRTVAIKYSAWSPYRRSEKNKYIEYINAIISLKEDDKANDNFKNDLLKYYFVTKRIINTPEICALRKIYIQFNEYRNALAHLKNNYSYEEMHQFFLENFEKCVEIIQQMPTAEAIKDGNDLSSHIFINLSNHPSSRWSEEQMSAAREYGDIIDIPFPQVDDFCDEDDILKLVDKYCKDILTETHGRIQNIVVHIMGEMTFTYAMVKELSLMGFTCLASTTERITEELPDGSKNVKFKFCRFRRYE